MLSQVEVLQRATEELVQVQARIFYTWPTETLYRRLQALVYPNV